MTSIHCVPLLAAILLLIPAALAQSVPSPASGQSLLDQPLVGDVALPTLGGQLTNGVDMAFAVATDKYPNTVNTGAVTLGFTVATALPVGGQVTFTVPKGYFTNVDSTKVNTFTGTSATCKCVGSAGAANDAMTCTLVGAGLAVGAATLSMAVGALTTGAPTSASTYNVQTTTDRSLSSAPATQQIGGVISGLATLDVNSADRLPNRVNTVVIKAAFTVVTPIPIGGKITLTFTKNYLSAVSATSVNTFNGKTTATCVLNAATETGTKDTVVCTTAVEVLAAAAQTLTFVVGSITTGLLPQAASTYTVSSSTDRESATANTVDLGGQLGTGTLIVFATPTNQVPGTVNTGGVSFSVVPVTAIPIGGKITIALPPKYFSAVDSTKVNTVTTAGDPAATPAVPGVAATATCVLTAGTTGTTVLAVENADTIICTTAGAIIPGTVGTTVAQATVFTFIAGAVTTGTPQAAITNGFNVATSTDRQLATKSATAALGLLATGGTIAIDAADRIPNQVNTKAITVSFASVTAVPTAGKITVTVPRGYFAKVDESKANTLTVPATTTATCALVQATGVQTKDSIICTTSGGLNAGGAQVLTFAAGTITTGGAVAQQLTAADVATSVDRTTTPSTTLTPLGGQLSAGVDLAFTNPDDKVPGKFTSNNATITLGFTAPTAIPIGGKITITLPQRYFTKVDSTKDNTVGASATAKCELANVAQTTVPAAIALTASTVSTSTTLTVSFVPSIVSGVTQVAIPLVGFSLDSTLSVACQASGSGANCLSSTAGKVTAALANGVLTLTLTSDNFFVTKNILTSIVLTGVTTPATAGWATTGIIATVFNPSTTVVCTTAGAIVAVSSSSTTFTFVAGSVTIGVGQKASIYQVETSVDLPLAPSNAKATVALGGGVTIGKPLAFANAQDQIPGRVNTGAISLGATLSNSVPIGGQFLLTFPSNYFTAVNPLSVVTLTKGTRRSLLQTSTLSCVRVAGNPNDQITCTLAGAASGTGAVVLTFPAGSLTTGLPTSTSGGFNLATANPPVGAARVPYFPKAAGSAYGVAWLLIALSALLACF